MRGDSANQITGIAKTTGTAGSPWVTPQYDQNSLGVPQLGAGNMTTMPVPGNEGDALTVTYDAWNRPVTASDGIAINERYAYDGLGRLIETQSDFVDNIPQAVTHYYYAGDQLLETRDASGPDASTVSGKLLLPHYQYVWSISGENAPILRDTYSSGSLVTGDRLYYLTDANSNVTAVTDASGAVQERYSYDAYGNVTVYTPDWSSSSTTSSSAINNTLLFGGMQRDAQTNLYYDRARWYNPSTGGFISQDPAQADANLYRYVGNDPIDGTDPSGMDQSGEGTPPEGSGQVPGAPAVPAPTPDCGAGDESEPVSVCFAAGTQVLLADGTTKPIEQIARGDQVRAVFHEDPEGPISAGEVVEVYQHGPRNLVEVEVGGQVIRATRKHPFYVRGRGFTAAAELRPGDTLRSSAGAWIPVGSVVENGHVEPVYNLQVADLHTYFVRSGGGDADLLVHNDSGQAKQPGGPVDAGWTVVRNGNRRGAGGQVIWRIATNPQKDNAILFEMWFVQDNNSPDRQILNSQMILQETLNGKPVVRYDSNSAMYGFFKPGSPEAQAIANYVPNFSTNPQAGNGPDIIPTDAASKGIYYGGVEWDAAKKKWISKDREQVGRGGPNGVPAYMKDMPMLTGGRQGQGDAVMKFESAVICPETGEVLGALTWGFKIGQAPGSPIEILNGNPADFSVGVSPDFKGLVNKASRSIKFPIPQLDNNATRLFGGTSAYK